MSRPPIRPLRRGAVVALGACLTATLTGPAGPALAADGTAPQITVAPISPAQYQTGSSAQKVHVRATVTEDSGTLSGVTARLFNPHDGSSYTASLTRTAGTDADGTWEGDVTLPQRAHWYSYWTTVTATDSAGNSSTTRGNDVTVTWYEPYRPDVRFVDACGTANDRVLHDAHGRVESWSVLGPVQRLSADSYAVTAAGKPVQVNVFVPKGSSTVISQDGSTDMYAATFSHTFTNRPCPIPKAPVPKITGTPKVGHTLTARPGNWTPGTRLSLQWLRNGTVIKGATRVRYRVVAADKGKHLQVRVTGRKAGMQAVTRTSARTSGVRAGVSAWSGQAVARPDERNSSVRLGDGSPEQHSG